MDPCRLAVLWFGFVVRWQGLGPCRSVVVMSLLIGGFCFFFFFEKGLMGFGVVLVVVGGGLWV